MRHNANKIALSVTIASGLLLMGCAQSLSTTLPTLVPSPNTPTTAPPTGFPNVIQVNNPVATIVTPLPSAKLSTPTLPAPPVAPTLAPTVVITGDKMRVKIFLVAPNDNGKSGLKIGCNDSLVAVERDVKATPAVLTSALTELFSLKTQTYGQSGLMTALYQSNLQLKSAQLVNGIMVVNLTGTPKFGGACDVPRFKEQISATVRQFPSTANATILLNGVALDKIQ